MKNKTSDELYQDYLDAVSYAVSTKTTAVAAFTSECVAWKMWQDKLKEEQDE